MTAVLAIGAVGFAGYLIISAINAIARVTALERHGPGRWGIASWQSTRRRPLDAHERRWQTALTVGKDDAARWGEFVTSLARLENAAGRPPDLDRPESYDRRWIEQRLAELESRTSDYPLGGTTR